MAVESEGLFIILRKIKYGEADLIVHALSSDGEKMSFLARGALKSKRRFGGGVLEPSHHVRLTYATSQKSEIHTLKEAQLMQGFESLRTDYDRLTFALTALDCVAKVSLEGDSGSSSLYNLLGHLLKTLETSHALSLIKIQFYLKFLLQQGVLEVEDWMRPFLKANMNEVSTLSVHLKEAESRCLYMEKSVIHYVQNAQVTH